VKKIRIGIDLDSVLSDLSKHWLELYNRDYNDNLKHSDITVLEWDKIVCKECGKKIYDYLLTPNFFREVPVMSGSQDVVQWLSTFDNVELYVVTAYHPYTCKDKTDWLAEYFPCINQKNIIFCNHKNLINVDFLIDDSPYNCNGFKNQYIVFDAPYNQCLSDIYVRVHNWTEIMDYFHQTFCYLVDANLIIKKMEEYIC
jgi:5'(3')-deoxyribonucleotidase